MSQLPESCPICGKPTARKDPNFPFCSPRCKTIDLGAWSAEEYVVSRPVTEADEHYEAVADTQAESNETDD